MSEVMVYKVVEPLDKKMGVMGSAYLTATAQAINSFESQGWTLDRYQHSFVVGARGNGDISTLVFRKVEA